MTTPPVPNADETYLRDQENLRAHERDMAKEQRFLKDDRRKFIGRILAGIATVAVLLTAIGAVWSGSIHSDDARVRIEKERTGAVKACIDAGYIWANDSCIPPSAR